MIRRTDQPLAPRKSLADLAYDRIKEDILRGVLRPGEPISTGGIAESLQISQMPVRGALTRLEAEGLVLIAPQRGVTVSTISPEELHENSVIRSRLEGLAANLACGNATETHVDALRRILQQMQRYVTADDSKRWLIANAQFHELIIACSQNTILVRLLTDLRHQGLRSRMVTGHVPGHMVRRNEEHERIVEALALQDAKLAERRMCQHILAAGRELIEFVRSAPESLGK